MPGGLHPPLSVVQNWPEPNYVNPATRGMSGIWVLAILTALAVAVVGLRLWTRFRLQRNPGLDDWFIILAMPPVIGLSITTCLALKIYNFDRHVWDIPVPEFIPQRKVTWALMILYVVASCLVKISLLLFYQRLAHGTGLTPIVYAIWATLGSIVGYMVSFVVMLCFSCTPFSAFWNQLDPQWAADNNYTCVNEGASLIASAVISVVQDFIVASLPVLLFFKLQMHIHRKLQLAVVFAFGYFLCACGVVRIRMIWMAFYESYDITWVVYPLWTWTGVEVIAAPILASMPALRVFYGLARDGNWNKYIRSANNVESSFAPSQHGYIRSRDPQEQVRPVGKAGDVRIHHTIDIVDTDSDDDSNRRGEYFRQRNAQAIEMGLIKDSGERSLRSHSCYAEALSKS